MPRIAVADAAVMSLMLSNGRHTPGGADADNTKVVKPEPGTIAGAIVVSRGGRLPPRQYLPILWLAPG